MDSVFLSIICVNDLMLIPALFVGAVPSRSDVSFHGSSAGPAWPVEPFRPQPFCLGYNGHCLGKKHLVHLLPVEIL